MAEDRDLNRQIDSIMQRLEATVVDYSKKDRRRITRKAAQKIAQAARRGTGFDDSQRPHFRTSGQQRIQYNPGNLRRSLRVLPLSRTGDAFVGPQFARRRASAYGGSGQPVDGYYAAMIYGSAAAFQSRELIPALRRGRSAALAILEKESDKVITTRGIRRGLNFKR